MIFMSQSGLTDGERMVEWDRWYVDHLRIMATVPGIYSAQRFRTATPGHSPSLAIYGVRSAAVFDDPYYLSVRGMGEWRPLIDGRYYQRNLFAGLDTAPEVRADFCLLVVDRSEPAPATTGFTWLQSVALDRSTPYRGIAVVEAGVAPSADDGVAVYRPATPRYAGAAP